MKRNSSKLAIDEIRRKLIMNKVRNTILHIIFFASILIGIPCAIFGLSYLIERFKSIGVVVHIEI